jgi:hypothetical protein
MSQCLTPTKLSYILQTEVKFQALSTSVLVEAYIQLQAPVSFTTKSETSLPIQGSSSSCFSPLLMALQCSPVTAREQSSWLSMHFFQY